MDMFDRLIAREGGDKVTNDPVDPGGMTKYGISKRAHPDVDVAKLTYEQAKTLYIQHYYNGPGLYKLPEPLQEVVLDFTVHSGQQPAVKTMQKLLGVEQDGSIGPVTVGAAEKVANNPQLIGLFLRAYQRERAAYLIRQIQATPAKLKYAMGWIMRVLNL